MESNHHSVSKEKVPQTKKVRAAPQVRQTLTSKYRLLKANPLLVHELEKKITSNAENKEDSIITPLKTLVTVLDTDSEALSKFNISYNSTQIFRTATVLKNDTNLRRCESNKEISKHVFARPLDIHRKKLTIQNNLKKSESKQSQPVRKLITKSVDRNLNTVSSFKSIKKDLNTGRSFTTVQKTKSVKHVNTDVSASKNKKPVVPVPAQSNSQQVVNERKQCKTQNNTITMRATTNYNEVLHSSNFGGRVSTAVTPNNKPRVAACAEMYNQNKEVTHRSSDVRNTLSPALSARKNSLFNTPNNRRKTIFVSKQTSNEITQRLSEWLKHKGKSFKEYHHLKCFGVHAGNTLKVDNSDVEKENVENSVLIENADIIKETPVPPTEEVNLSVVAQEALMDLHKLILDGYPPEQCEIWLKLINQKYRQVEDEPQYWECRAALEQTKGNINLAVECYKTAIVQGAEVQNVDKCLDQLLQKFSLLNINNEMDSYASKNDRSKIIQDARNIFKSSIIQFAVQEKVMKKKSKEGFTIEKRVVATPVRRSTRLSRSAFTSTPGIHIYSSLQEIDTSIRGNLNFQCNNALKE